MHTHIHVTSPNSSVSMRLTTPFPLPRFPWAWCHLLLLPLLVFQVIINQWVLWLFPFECPSPPLSGILPYLSSSGAKPPFSRLSISWTSSCPWPLCSLSPPFRYCKPLAVETTWEFFIFLRSSHMAIVVWTSRSLSLNPLLRSLYDAWCEAVLENMQREEVDTSTTIIEAGHSISTLRSQEPRGQRKATEKDLKS